MTDDHLHNPEPILSLIAELEHYLQAPTMPCDARFASVRWEIIRRTAGHLAVCPRDTGTGAPRAVADPDPGFEADWRAFVASWPGARIFGDWPAFRQVASLILRRLHRRLAPERPLSLVA